MGSNFAAHRSGAIVQKPEGPNTYNLKIWLYPSGNHALARTAKAAAIWSGVRSEDTSRVSPSDVGEDSDIAAVVTFADVG